MHKALVLLILLVGMGSAGMVRAADYRIETWVDGLDQPWSLAFLPGGNAIVYVRGGSPNADGELPNPASLPEGGEFAIYIVPLDGGEPRKLDDGAGAVKNLYGLLAVNLEAGMLQYLQSCLVNEFHFTVRKRL